MGKMGTATTGEVCVSVLITTYKHERYIGECLDSILSQETDFRYEVIVGVDDGGDRTAEICLEYQRKYPGLLRVIINEKDNVLTVKGARTGRYNFLNILSKAVGKYIARCDGDDYWTDRKKLQKQVDFLEANSDCVVCHAWHEYAHPSENGYVIKPAPTEGQGYLPAEKSTAKEIFENKLRIKSRTIMFRNVLKEIPEWFHKITYGDVAVSMMLGKFGKFGFINEVVAVYRLTGEGASTAGKEKPEFVLKQFIEWVRIWEYGLIHYDFEYKNEALTTIYSFYDVIFRKYNYSFKTFRKMLKYVLLESQLGFFTRLRISMRLGMKFLSARLKGKSNRS
jgi:glycosyltransferase involved in cell wall biosynthesis